MKEINIAKTLITKRKEKAITQDKLAEYIGVSKASVSKWETGQSYPDITFLPQLAAYFNISIDELIGYEPQMTKDDIKKLYNKLAGEFSSKPFEEVLDKCHEVIKKYYSCFPLLVQMAVLLTNHYMLANGKEAQESVLHEVIDLCQRIRTEEDDVCVTNEANSLEATCSLMLQHPEEVQELLNGTMKPKPSDEVILASAYQMTGNIQKAKEVLQVGIYHHLINIMDILPSYFILNQDVSKQFENILQRTISTAELFNLNKLHPGVMLKIYLTAAQCYAMQNNQDKAIDMIRKYADICTSESLSFELHGDEFFDSIDNWFAEFDLGNQAPRDEKVIKRSILQAITENPAFAAFKDQPKFKNILESVKSKLGNL